MDKIFCPLIKEDCKGECCVLQSGDSCLAVDYLKGQVVWAPAVSRSSEEPEESDEEKLLRAFRDVTAEELSRELVEFVLTSYPDDHLSWGGYSGVDDFWAEKGLANPFAIPGEIKIKKAKAERLAEAALRKERDRVHNEKLTKEKERIPELTGEAIGWARENKMIRSDKLTKGDLELFLQGKDLLIMNETRNMLWSRINVELRSKTKGVA
jgi:hypothetical protein